MLFLNAIRTLIGTWRPASSTVLLLMLALPAHADDVTYDYDGQGRLVAAVDNTINTGTKASSTFTTR